MRRLAFVVVTAALVGAPARAQQAAPPAASCAAAEYRQFDFWVGQWNVTDSTGFKVGESEITREFGGCVIRERWNVRTARGGGESLNGWDAARRVWHQTWMDGQGNVAQIERRLEGPSMILTRTAPSPRDTTVMVVHRWTWTPSDADHVRQLWETSTDGGKTWRTQFDGRYARRA